MYIHFPPACGKEYRHSKYFYSLHTPAVTAQTVSVDSSPQPSCANEPLVFNCSVHFPAFFIRWDHPVFSQIIFRGIKAQLGSNSSAIDGRVVAELTMKDDDPSGLHRFASTLIIYPPLTDLNNINLDNTNIMCVGSDGSGDKINSVSIMLEGEKLKIIMVSITMYVVYVWSVVVSVYTGDISTPDNLTSPATNSLADAVIEWDAPLYSGRGIANYTISVPFISYIRSETGTSHTIQTNVGSGVQFYDVHVTAISVCGSVSEPANYSLRIQPSGE